VGSDNAAAHRRARQYAHHLLRQPQLLRDVLHLRDEQGEVRWLARRPEEGDKRGNAIIELDAKETARWKEASQPVIDAWIKEMDAKGLNGKQLVEDTRALIAKYAGPAK
jgi:hypothetical protein